MRRRMFAALAIVGLLAAALASASPARALSTWIAKVRSDCTAAQAEMTLVWGTDDGSGYDRFRLELYDEANGALLTSVTEQISRQQSPWYWQTHRMAGPPSAARYRIEVWDIDAGGNRISLLDDMRHDCETHNSWRVHDRSLEVSGCRASMSFYTTNLAPEPGIVTAVWSYGRHPQVEANSLLALWHVERGQGLDSTSRMDVPCSVFVKLFYQPDTSRLLYFMPSQFWPNEGYGTASAAGDSTPRYFTYFPLDGPRRPPDQVEH